MNTDFSSEAEGFKQTVKKKIDSIKMRHLDYSELTVVNTVLD